MKSQELISRFKATIKELEFEIFTLNLTIQGLKTQIMLEEFKENKQLKTE